ncbi:hypothetical protein Tco_0229755 [Tanacetum coccineum]
MTQSKETLNGPTPQGTGSGSGPRRQDTMGDTIDQTSSRPETTKTAQAKEITILKKRVKKLEQRGRSRTPGLKRLYKVGTSRRVESSAKASLDDQEDTSKLGRNIAKIAADVDMSLVHVDSGI